MSILHLSTGLEAWVVIDGAIIYNDVPGTIEGNTVRFVDTRANGRALHVFEGTVDGDTISGTWTRTLDGEVEHQGSFSVTRQ